MCFEQGIEKLYFIEISKLKLYSDLVWLATRTCDPTSHWLQVSSQVQVPISKSQVSLKSKS